MMGTFAALALVAGVAPLLPLGLGLYNRVSWPRPPGRDEGHAAQGSVSVVIPARNEEQNIRGCVEAALAQGSIVGEVLVYSDESTDETEVIVRSLALLDPRVRLLVGGPLPKGWVGKPYACQQLAAQARGPWLLFVDADVRLRAGAASGLLHALLQEQMQHDQPHQIVSALPEQLPGRWPLDLLQPLLVLTYVSWLPLAWANRQHDWRLVAGCGQLLLLSKSAFTRLGGFSDVRGAVVDDVEFCRQARRKGVPVAFLDGHDLATCRMYESGRAFWLGFAKNLFLGLGSEFNLALALVLHAACFLLPFAVLVGSVAGWFGPRVPDYLFAAASIGVLANVLYRIVLARRHGHPALAVILHPFAVVVLMVLALDSWRRTRFSRLEWAGRSYEGRLA